MTQATGSDQIVRQSREQSIDLPFNLAQPHLGGAAATLGHILFVTSVIAAMISFHNTTARYVFALGREGALGILFLIFVTAIAVVVFSARDRRGESR